MASQVQTANTADGSFGTLAFGSNVTSGNLLIVFMRVSTGDGTPTGVTDTVGTTYSQIGSAMSISGGTGYLYAGTAAASGANTVTIGGGAIARILVEEVSGLTSPTLDQTNQATGTSSSADSGNITTTAATWIFAGLVMTSYPSVGPTAGTGFTGINLSDGNKYCGEYQNATSAGTYSGAYTLPESNTWGVIVAAFKSSGGSSPVLPALLATVTRRIGA